MPAKSGTDWSNVPARLGSALVIAVVVVVALWFGGWVWALLIAIGAGRIGFEWGRMIQPNVPTGTQAKVEGPQRWVFAILMPVMAFYTILSIRYGWPLREMALTFTIIAALGAVFDKSLRRWNAVGAIYLVLPVISAIWLRGFGQGFGDDGFQRVIFVVLIVAAADVGAYFSGKSIGGPKLAPKLSPNKTWAGFGGGLVLGALLGGALAQLMGGVFIKGVLVGAVLVVAAVFGDFLESGFKRRFGVKDTGSILPGHGGVLDRVDSHMTALTVAAIVLVLAPQLSPV